MSSFLPFVPTQSIVPGPLVQIPRLGFTRQPFVFDKIEPEPVVHPDIVKKQAAQARSRLGDESLMKMMRMLMNPGQMQVGATNQVMPSSLDIRK